MRKALPAGNLVDFRFDTLDYRDQHIDFYEIPEISQIYAIWNRVKIDLEVDNRSRYIESIKQIIDYQLDTIKEFSYPEMNSFARLEFFDNAGHRDIRLLYNNRIIKIYVVSNHEELNFINLIADAQELIKKISYLT